MFLSFWTDLSMRFLVLLNAIVFGLNIYFFSVCDLCYYSMNRIQKKASKDTKGKHPYGWWSKQSTYICSLSLFRTTDTVFPLNLSSRTINSRKNILPYQFVKLVNFCLDRIFEKIQAGGGMQNTLWHVIELWAWRTR
jgi:hypothetical protein